MTNYDAGEKKLQADPAGAEASWTWLRDRIPPSKVAMYSQWLTVELTTLEDRFSGFITKRSRSRDVRDELKQGSRRG